MLRIVRLPMLPTLAAALVARWWLHGGDGPRAADLHQQDRVVPRRRARADRAGDARRAAREQPALAALAAGLAGLRAAPAASARSRWRCCCGAFTCSAGRRWTCGAAGWPAELLILTAGVPTAVGTLLLTLELEGDADLAADCVFWTTVFSCVTIAIWLVILRLWFGCIERRWRLRDGIVGEGLKRDPPPEGVVTGREEGCKVSARQNNVANLRSSMRIPQKFTNRRRFFLTSPRI